MPKVGDLEYFGDDMSDHEWGTSTSAACCLKIMAYLMRDEILDPVIEYAGQRSWISCTVPQFIQRQPTQQQEAPQPLLIAGDVGQGAQSQ